MTIKTEQEIRAWIEQIKVDLLTCPLDKIDNLRMTAYVLNLLLDEP